MLPSRCFRASLTPVHECRSSVTELRLVLPPAPLQQLLEALPLLRTLALDNCTGSCRRWYLPALPHLSGSTAAVPSTRRPLPSSRLLQERQAACVRVSGIVYQQDTVNPFLAPHWTRRITNSTVGALVYDATSDELYGLEALGGKCHSAGRLTQPVPVSISRSS